MQRFFSDNTFQEKRVSDLLSLMFNGDSQALPDHIISKIHLQWLSTPAQNWLWVKKETIVIEAENILQDIIANDAWRISLKAMLATYSMFISLGCNRETAIGNVHQFLQLKHCSQVMSLLLQNWSVENKVNFLTKFSQRQINQFQDLLQFLSDAEQRLVAQAIIDQNNTAADKNNQLLQILPKLSQSTQLSLLAQNNDHLILSDKNILYILKNLVPENRYLYLMQIDIANTLKLPEKFLLKTLMLLPNAEKHKFVTQNLTYIKNVADFLEKLEHDRLTIFILWLDNLRDKHSIANHRQQLLNCHKLFSSLDYIDYFFKSINYLHNDDIVQLAENINFNNYADIFLHLLKKNKTNLKLSHLEHALVAMPIKLRYQVINFIESHQHKIALKNLIHLPVDIVELKYLIIHFKQSISLSYTEEFMQQRVLQEMRANKNRDERIYLAIYYLPLLIKNKDILQAAKLLLTVDHAIQFDNAVKLTRHIQKHDECEATHINYLVNTQASQEEISPALIPKIANTY